jgi:phosphotriesterase-related protein
MQDVEVMAAEMQAAAREGVAAIVDGGHDDMGRSVAFLREVSERSGLPIVVSGGYYTDPFHPPELANQSDDDIAAALAEAATAERWGAFGEIGSSAEITPSERKAFSAVGKAHLLTNVPIFTHTANGLAAEEQLDLFESLGVPAGSVAIGHLGGLDDPEAAVHRRIAARGAFVGFDRLGGGPDADQHKVPMIRALIEAGHVDRVLLASDFAAAEDIQRNGGPGYARTITRFVPMLREAGVTDEQVRAMTVENPLRFLAFVPPTA